MCVCVESDVESMFMLSTRGKLLGANALTSNVVIICCVLLKNDFADRMLRKLLQWDHLFFSFCTKKKKKDLLASVGVGLDISWA